MPRKENIAVVVTYPFSVSVMLRSYIIPYTCVSQVYNKLPLKQPQGLWSEILQVTLVQSHPLPVGLRWGNRGFAAVVSSVHHLVYL